MFSHRCATWQLHQGDGFARNHLCRGDRGGGRLAVDGDARGGAADAAAAAAPRDAAQAERAEVIVAIRIRARGERFGE